MSEAFDYIQDSGLGLQSSYPYKGRDQKCSEENRRQTGRVEIVGHEELTTNTNVETLS